MTTRCQVCGPVGRPAFASRIGLRRRGFTYIESMIAMTVLSLAGAALLNSVFGAVASSNDALYRSVGQGFADQLLDEIAAAKFPTGTATAVASTFGRSSFATIDDYSDWNESPPRTKSGEVLGSDGGATDSTAYMTWMTSGGSRAAELKTAPGFVDRFTRSVLIERVLPGSTGWTVQTTHTPYRRVTVTVTYTAAHQPAKTVARATRVFSSLAPSP